MQTVSKYNKGLRSDKVLEIRLSGNIMKCSYELCMGRGGMQTALSDAPKKERSHRKVARV
eukprot:13258907-Heterocapsa_arctica.AAC.1